MGKTIRESNIAARHRVTILGIRREGGEPQIMPGADDLIRQGEHLIVLASHETAKRLLKQIPGGTPSFGGTIRKKPGKGRGGQAKPKRQR